MAETIRQAEGSSSVAGGKLKETGLLKDQIIYVDVIIPVHNAEDTIEDAVRSAMVQVFPPHLLGLERPSDGRSSRSLMSPKRNRYNCGIDVAICCYDDGSTDGSWSILCRLERLYRSKEPEQNKDYYDVSLASENFSTTARQRNEPMHRLKTNLLIGKSTDGVARGAGYARNQAIALRSSKSLIPARVTDALYFLCLLDSDDTMHCTRVAEQVSAMLSVTDEQINRTILGCNFDRDPPDSTWHYSQWANSLSDERLMLERYREVTVLQPTWFMSKSRFIELGGYIEAPHPSLAQLSNSAGNPSKSAKSESFQMIHPYYDTPQSLRLAEDLRLFHAHLHANGLLRLHRTSTALVTYRHRVGVSQSSQTPRRLLLHLRVLAFERDVLRSDPHWLKFIVWGAGRDGKDFIKALSSDLRRRVVCFADVDHKKISAGYYLNKELNVKIPIVHFSMLISDPETREEMIKAWEDESRGNNGPQTGQIDKSKPLVTKSSSAKCEKQGRHKVKQEKRPEKKRKLFDSRNLNVSLLARLPVVVCVAMYRTNGVLEKNVHSIGRTEGKDLWHFS